MKIVITAIAFLFNSLFSISQTSESWYKVYTGKAGNLSATLHLCKADKNYSGYIWFDKIPWPMPLYYNEPAEKTDSLIMSASSGSISIVLSGILKGDNYTGNSVLAKENSPSKTAPFQLQLSNEKKFTPFEYYFTHGHSKLLPEIKNESEFDYISATIWPVDKGILSEAIKKQIRLLLSIPATITQPAKWIADQKTKYMAAWKKNNSKMSPKEASEMGLSLSEEEESRVMVMYENELYINLANYNYSFTGGAHGNYATTLVTLNKANGKVLQLTDVLTAAGIKSLPSILDRVARIQYDIKNNNPLDQNDFLVKKIEPAKNFYITTNGIGFLYATYELKSFAEGEVNLFIPFTALNNYLQPSFKH
ncbi:MAG: DUF3298 domain-containing protein [Ginsengibacter sp.]